MSDVIRDLKERSLISADASNLLDECFSGLSREIIHNHFSNQNRTSNGYRHNEEVKKFAVSLHYFSPTAYEYVRSVFALPSGSSIRNWTLSINCQPGFFIDVFKELENKIKYCPEYQDCALICDAMSIKASTIYNKHIGRYEGFIDYGPDIVVDDENKIPTDALVFMLVGLKGHWKYPIGYTLCDKHNAETLKCFLSNALIIASTHNIQVHSITMDGASANISAMKLFVKLLGLRPPPSVRLTLAADLKISL